MIYALWGEVTRDILTLGGRPIVHPNREEMEFLMPQAKVVPVTEADLKARSPLEPMQLRNHPALMHITWPLDRKDFR